MKMKSMVQLLAPFAISIVFYIVWCIIMFICDEVFNLFLRGDTPYNVFDFDQASDVIFWIINIGLIIGAELYITSIPDKEFE